MRLEKLNGTETDTAHTRAFLILRALGKWINKTVLVLGVVLIAYGVDRRSQQQFAKRIEAKEVEGMSGPMSEHWQVKPGSIYDGDTLRVVRDGEEMKIRFCGIDAPEKDQARGIEARDYLRSLVAQGDGSVVLVPVETDRYGRTVAELFVMTNGGELHLNSEMAAAGMAFHYAQYSDNCPNREAIVMAEEMAKEQRLGVWGDASPEYPWEWRRK